MDARGRKQRGTRVLEFGARRATLNPWWTSDQTRKAQCSLALWDHEQTPYLPLPSPPSFQLCLPSPRKSSHIHSCSSHPSPPAGWGDPCTPRSRPEGCREPRLHSEWRAGSEELGCHFFLVKRKGKRSGAGGRWERGKPGRISSAPRPWKNSQPFYAEGAAAILASHSSLHADRGRKFCGRGLDLPVFPSGVR